MATRRDVVVRCVLPALVVGLIGSIAHGWWVDLTASFATSPSWWKGPHDPYLIEYRPLTSLIWQAVAQGWPVPATIVGLMLATAGIGLLSPSDELVGTWVLAIGLIVAVYFAMSFDLILIPPGAG